MRPTTRNGSTPGVLIVEDDAIVRSFLRSALETKARIFEATDAKGALEVLRARARNELHLVLADYRLPTGSGLDVLRATKKNWPWIAVVILTAYGSEELAVQAFRSGASDYLRKPIRLDELQQTVDSLARVSVLDGRGRGRAAAGARVIDPRVRWAVGLLDKHFNGAMTLARIAQDTHLSRFHFCRLFHRETGQRFNDYLRQVRVARATTLLEDDDLPVSEVGYAVGFKDPSHFAKAFRKVAGQSPTEYRASVRAAARRRGTRAKP